MVESQADVVKFPAGGVSIECADMEDTAALAGLIARSLKSGDVVLLDGELATGKTTFVSLVCRALDTFDQPSSPTYVISNVYRCPKFEVFHIDAYRLNGADEFNQLGLEEFFPDSVTFIEWGNRVSSVFETFLKIEIEFSGFQDEGRTYRFTSSGAGWHSLIAKLANHHRRRFDRV